MSPRREALLNEIVKKSSTHQSVNRKVLLQLCKTRWSERHESYQHFYQAFVYTVKFLEVIAYGLHVDDGYDPQLANDGNWDRESKSRATSLLHSLCYFSFIVTFITIYKLLSRLEGMTYLLQRKTNDIICATDMVEECKAEYLQTRSAIESYFEGVFVNICSTCSYGKRRQC